MKSLQEMSFAQKKLWRKRKTEEHAKNFNKIDDAIHFIVTVTKQRLILVTIQNMGTDADMVTIQNTVTDTDMANILIIENY